jgi:hypothetical protein
VLVPHLSALGIATSVLIVETSRDAHGRKRRGGGDWSKWQRDLHRLTTQQHGKDVRFTTLFDLYGLPKEFPGLEEHRQEKNTTLRASLLEQAMADSVGDRRLIPYLQRHEFEALVLAGLDVLEVLVDAADKQGVAALKQQVAHLPPEDVNDGAMTAPSKRIENTVPSYRKTVHGPLVVEAVGLPSLRAVLPRFDAWLSKLEALATPTIEGSP